jgi:hypothetical protein
LRIGVFVVDRHYCKVTAYAGYKANERPLYFSILPTVSNTYLDSPVKPGNDGLEVLERRNNDEQRHEVRDIISRWTEPDKDFFKVIADDGRVYTLSWNRKSDMWIIEKIT